MQNGCKVKIIGGPEQWHGKTGILAVLDLTAKTAEVELEIDGKKEFVVVESHEVEAV